MNWFKDLKIRTKLLISFLFIAILTGIVGFVGYTSLISLGQNQHTMYVDRLEPIRDLGYANAALLIARGDVRSLMDEETKNGREKFANGIRTETRKVDSLIEKYSRTILVNEAEETLPKFSAAWNQYKPLRDKAVELALNFRDNEAKNILDNEARTSLTEARKNLRALIDINARIAEELDSTSDVEASNSETLILIFVIGAIIIAIFIGLFLANFISKAIKQVLEQMESLSNIDMANVAKGSEQLANGDLNINIVTGTKPLDIKSKDEIGQLAENMNKVITNTQGTITSVKKAVESVKEIVSETQVLVSAAVSGKLSTRGNAVKFKGSYKELVEGLNATFDAIVKPINESSAVLESMADGDITGRITKDYPGDYKLLKDSINKFGEAMCDTLGQVSESVQATASASTQISSSTEELAAGAQEQSSQTTEVAGAVEEMTKTIIETTANASRASETAKASGNIAHDGGKVVSETIAGMNKIAEVVTQAAETVKELGSNSDKIGEIIQVIDDIADQTNLLALNAAIEAARAGEQGRGFAVVADEVRKLAERTTKATKEIAAMIKQIQKDTGNAVTSMEKGVEEVSSGKQLAQKAGDSLNQIINSSKEVIDNIAQVAAASEEQSSAAEQISKNIESISSVTQQSAAGTQQIAKAAEDLNRLTDNLQNLVSRFKISKETGYSVRQNGKLVEA
jgi:methyl-accepting chemotaxis protein